MDAIITLKKVCKSFGKHEIFHDFDLEIQRGDFVCITGESGKGKTTLLNIIGMLESPDSGTVTVNGVENLRNSRDSRSFGPIRLEQIQFKYLFSLF